MDAEVLSRPLGRIAFVSPPGASAFMEEVLAAVSSAVSPVAAPLGVEVISHHGYLSDVADDRTVCVVVPHEYFAVAPPEDHSVYGRTLSFGVEHPGTATFEASSRCAARLGGRFEIGEESVAELSRRGVAAEHFPLGYVPAWDHWQQGAGARTVDVAYLGTADERRLAILAGNAAALAQVRTELLIPPHEPMTAARPDFLTGEDKWRLLARSKILLNLHREGKTAFEWVRGLEAMANGCVVVSEPSTDLGPLRPGVHLLLAEPSQIGAVIRSALAQPDLIDSLARNAYDLCRTHLSMQTQAERLVAAARRVHQEQPLQTLVRPVAARPARIGSEREKPLAVWIPTTSHFPPEGAAADPWLVAQLRELESLRTRYATKNVQRATPPRGQRSPVDVICVQRPGDGPWRMTANSIRGLGSDAALHLGWPGRGPVADLTGAATIVTTDLLIGRGATRNALLRETEGEYVAVIDAGDRFLGDALQAMFSAISEDPALDVVYCMAAHGARELTNVLVPEVRRLDRTPYLTRGFLVRRRVLEKIGGFVEDPYLDEFVDHCFWLEVAQRDLSVRLLRRIGLDLWSREHHRSLAVEDEGSVMQHLRDRAAPA